MTISDDTICRRFGCSGFLSHLHSLVVTMSQKPSVKQSRQNGPGALTGDMLSRWRTTAFASRPSSCIHRKSIRTLVARSAHMQEIQGDRKDHRRGSLSGNVIEGGEIAQLHRVRLPGAASRRPRSV